MNPLAPRMLTIAQPVWQSLRVQPFAGCVAGVFRRACNLIDAEGRVVTLTLPSVGNGPFFIVAEAAEALFDRLQPRQPVRIDADHLIVGGTLLSLSMACVWDPTLPAQQPLGGLTPAIAAIVHSYAGWPRPAAATPLAACTMRALAEGAEALALALARHVGLAEAAQRLAGLGHGLTPAGDDYLLGVMAALWLCGDHQFPRAIAQAAVARTTTLSGAFLAAAARGQFTEAWHDLADALYREDKASCQEAVQRVAAFGASSGCDALAGFARTLLSLVHGG
jgi:hypothetical protein